MLYPDCLQPNQPTYQPRHKGWQAVLRLRRARTFIPGSVDSKNQCLESREGREGALDLERSCAASHAGVRVYPIGQEKPRDTLEEWTGKEIYSGLML